MMVLQHKNMRFCVFQVLCFIVKYFYLGLLILLMIFLIFSTLILAERCGYA